MNIHEHQSKELLCEYGAPVSKCYVIFSRSEIKKTIQTLQNGRYVLKAQIHAGGRGKAGGVKLVNDKSELLSEANKMMGKVLITNQTGSDGKEVKRIYIEEASEISKEFYLSCLIDRESSKIAFISSIEGGMDIEKGSENPEKIITNKIDIKQGPDKAEIEEIISIFNLIRNKKLLQQN